MSDFFNVNVNKGICIISLKRNPVNALSFDFLAELKNTFIDLEKDNSLRVVIINSSTNHFSAGADLKERKIMSKNESCKALDNFNECFNIIENFSKPTLCCIHGYCLGGGAELASACDIRIGSKDCIIGFPEVSIGIIPGAGGTQRLPRIIGLANAKYWIYTAKKFSGEDAFKYGFLTFLTSYQNLNNKAHEIALEIIANAPIAVTSSKTSISNGYDEKINDGLNIERKAYNIALNTVDRDEALQAFTEKRKPQWKNK